MKLASIAWRNIFRNWRRSLLSGTAIGVAALVIVLMFSFLAGMMQDLFNNTWNYSTGHLRVRDPEYTENEALNPLHLRVADYRQVLERLEGSEDVAAAAPRIQFFTSIYENEQTYHAFGYGVDFSREESFMDPAASLVSGRLPREGEREMLLTTGLARQIGAGAGDRVTLLGKNMYLGMTGMTFSVSGIVHFPLEGLNDRLLVVPLETARGFLQMDDAVTEILVKTPDPDRLEGAVERIGGLLAADRPALAAESWKEIGIWYSWMRMAEVSYAFVALFFFILGTTVIVNTTMMVIYERMREIGTVAALGMTGREIVRLFFLEALFISLIASLAGVLLGSAITAVLAVQGVNFGAVTEGLDFNISQILYPRLNLNSTVFVFLYSTVVASLASFIPSLRAARIQPVQALRAV